MVDCGDATVGSLRKGTLTHVLDGLPMPNSPLVDGRQ